MKKTSTIKKLNLQKQTVQRLNTYTLGKVKAGVAQEATTIAASIAKPLYPYLMLYAYGSVQQWMPGSPKPKQACSRP